MVKNVITLIQEKILLEKSVCSIIIVKILTFAIMIMYGKIITQKLFVNLFTKEKQMNNICLESRGEQLYFKTDLH